MKLGTLFAMDSLEKRDSAITNAIFLIKIEYPTELNDLTNLFGCQLYSGTNETYSCTYAIPDALLWRVNRAKLEFVEIAIKVDRQIYWLKLSKCFFVAVFLSKWCQANKPVSSIVLFLLLFFVIVFCQLQCELEVWLNQEKGSAGRQVEPALPVANDASSIELQTESLSATGRATCCGCRNNN